MQIVFLCSRALSLITSNRFCSPFSSISDAFTSWTLKHVSKTSEDVKPWCTNLELSPINCERYVRKAITSCLVIFSISSISLISYSKPLALRTLFVVPLGMEPNCSIASQAYASISNQILYFSFCDHTFVISGLE